MKRLLSICMLAAAGLFWTACNQDDDNDVTPQPSTPGYYFKFKLDGRQINLTLAEYIPQLLSMDENRIGGFKLGEGVGHSMMLAVNYTHPVSNAEVLALAGKTLYFNDTAARPELVYDSSATASSFESIQTTNPSYNLQFTSVTYLRQDSTVFNPLDVYEVKGTCSGILSDGSVQKTLTNGEFFMLISRVRQ
jgi:hypothetical protein